MRIAGNLRIVESQDVFLGLNDPSDQECTWCYLIVGR
jgi:hypothetical protein